MKKIFFLFIILYSCNLPPKNVRKIINKSNNKDEFLKLFDHYKNDKKKLAAVYFLIENMDSKYSKIFNASDYLSYFTDIKDLNSKIRDSIINRRINDIENNIGLSSELNYKADINTINSNYLIKNIDLAFFVWENYPWCSEIDFDTFCKYILPYRLYDEPLCEYREFFINEFNWLKDSLQNPKDLKEACLFLNNFLAKDFIFSNELGRLPFFSVIDLYNFRAGDCEQRYFLIVSIMRSLGIPVAIDFTFQWSIWPGKHSWVTLIHQNKNYCFNAGEFCKNFYTSKIPIGEGKATTVYRRTYEINYNSPSQFEDNFYNIPSNLRDNNIKNISNEYNYPQTQIVLEIKKFNSNNCVYLGSFGYSDKIIAVDFIKPSKKIIFSNIGKCGIYVPFQFENNTIKFLSNPFFISCENSSIIYYNPLNNERINMEITRKYPIQDSMKIFAKNMVGAKFEASNNLNFKTFECLHTISNPPNTFEEIIISNKKKFKYIRYSPCDTCSSNIAEIVFQNSNKIIEYFNYIYSNNTSKNLKDNNIRTNYFSSTGTISTFKFKKPENITKIRYLPRNNFNIIEINDIYELLYFDYGWQSLGIQKATKNHLIYNSPKNSLFLLKNLTKGKEERIFIYENGKQLFR